MRNKAIIALVMLTTKLASCQQSDIKKIKDDDFKKYVSCFQVGKLPFSTYENIKISYHDFDTSQIHKFICKDDFCLKDWSGYDIPFASYLLLPSNGDYVILIHDESTDGGTVRKLSTYDYYGNKLDELDIFADKPFHGEREKNEISHYEIESVISEDLIIEKKYFAIEPTWTEGKEFFYYGTHIEYKYKIEKSGKIILLDENKYGRKKYKGVRLKTNEFPRYILAE